MLRQFWRFFLVLVMIFFSPFRLFLPMWYQSNLKFNNGTLPVSKLNAGRPVTLAHNSVTDKYFTAIWNRSFPHCSFFLSFFLFYLFFLIEFLRLIRLFDWFVLLSSHVLYYLFSPLQFSCVRTQNMQFFVGTTPCIEILLFCEVFLPRF